MMVYVLTGIYIFIDRNTKPMSFLNKTMNVLIMKVRLDLHYKFTNQVWIITNVFLDECV